jgi:hypothetical protein
LFESGLIDSIGLQKPVRCSHIFHHTSCLAAEVVEYHGFVVFAFRVQYVSFLLAGLFLLLYLKYTGLLLVADFFVVFCPFSFRVDEYRGVFVKKETPRGPSALRSFFLE